MEKDIVNSIDELESYYNIWETIRETIFNYFEELPV